MGWAMGLRTPVRPLHLGGLHDEAISTPPEQSGRALPPSEFRPQPDHREGVLRRAAVPLAAYAALDALVVNLRRRWR
ncbi:MAG: hypothetical protein ACRD01_12045 [Terriglobales bacterium]